MTTEVLTGMEALPASVTTVTANSPSLVVGFLPEIGTASDQIPVGRSIVATNHGTGRLDLRTNRGMQITSVEPGMGGVLKATSQGYVWNPGAIIQPQLQNSRGKGVVTNRGWVAYTALSSGNNQSVTYRMRHWALRIGRITGLRLVYSNFMLDANGESDTGNDITIKASIEYGGLIYPVFFNGRRSAVVENGAQIVSDPVGVSIRPGAGFYTRTNVSVSQLGQKWPCGPQMVPAEGEGYTSGSDTTDVTGNMTANNAQSFGPTAILGYVQGSLPTVAIIGSSSAAGQGDSATGDGNLNVGYLSRFLGLEVGHVRTARSGDTLALWLTRNRRRMQYLATVNPTHIIQQLGGNDLRDGATLQQMKDRLTEIWDILDSLGAKIIQSTYSPICTSTDQFKTLAGQTRSADWPIRNAVNEWIRSQPAPLAGVLECCIPFESSPGSGLWKVDGTANKWTADGTHVTAHGHQYWASLNSVDALGL